MELQIFDTRTTERNRLLTKENFDDVVYASTRMLHAWNIPAFINNQPYIDGSYTSLCPVASLAALGYNKILCIAPEKDKVVYDLFSNEEIPSHIGNSAIEFIKPNYDLKELGVDFYTLTWDGLDQVYTHGYEKGLDYLKNSIKNRM